MNDNIDILDSIQYNNDIDEVKEYVKSGGNVNKIDEHGFTPLHIASEEGLYDIVQYLISNGAKINVQNEYGSTPIHYASKFGRYEIVEYLIHKGAELNVKDKNVDGGTPLHYASYYGDCKIAELLIAHSADVTIPNIMLKRARDIAKEKGHNNILKLIANAAEIRRVAQERSAAEE